MVSCCWTALSLCYLVRSANAFVIAPFHVVSSVRSGHRRSRCTAGSLRMTQAPDDSVSSSSSSSSPHPHKPGVHSVDLRNRRVASNNAPPPHFLQGDDLYALRARVLQLSQELHSLRALLPSTSTSSDSHSIIKTRISQLEDSILQAQQVDAEFVYTAAQQRRRVALHNQQAGLVSHYERIMQQARDSLPQLQLQGLWVGKFASGRQGGGTFELINVTYTDNDTLVAHRVTGRDPSSTPLFVVPFTTEDPATADNNNKALPPIELPANAMSDASANLWGGQKFLPRYGGRGRLWDPLAESTTIDFDGTISLPTDRRRAREESESRSQESSFFRAPEPPVEWVDGQLILVSHQYFAFYWTGGEEHSNEQVFFGRPSPELTLKLLRRQTMHQDPIREHLNRCWLETEHVEDELQVEGYNVLGPQTSAGASGGNRQEPDDYYGVTGCFE